MILFRAVSAIRVGKSQKILLPFIALYYIPARGYKVIVCTPAGTLKKQLSPSLETALYIFEHCEMVLQCK